VRLIRFLLLLVLALAFGGAAHSLPITLTLEASATSLMDGESLTVTVKVDGLDDDGQVALESFDLDLSFDETRLSFDSITFGITLGDPDDNLETFITGPGTPNTTGVVAMGEFSFLSEASLLALQSSPPLLLATIEFTALDELGTAVFEFINLGSSSLGGVSGAALGDELTPPSALNVSIVPEPAVGVLLLAGLALAQWRRRSTGG
jgi:hypothetical protein